MSENKEREQMGGAGTGADRAKVLDLIFGCIDEVNRQLPPDARLVKSAATVLVGEGGVLDSLGLITLLVAVEEALSTRMGLQCVVLDEDILADPEGPYQTVEGLAQWIAARTAGR